MAKLIDRALAAVGLQRRTTRIAKRGAYQAARVDRLSLDWIVSPLSGDRALEGDLLKLRERSRALCRDTPWAKRYLRLAQQNIVGPCGIHLEAKNVREIGRGAGALNDPLNEAIEEGWEDFGSPAHCSTSGRLSWVELQRLAVAGLKRDGEACFQIIRDRRFKYGVALHPVDPDQLDERLMVRRSSTANEIRYGVELDAFGRVVAYHIVTKHPSEEYGQSRRHERIPAADFIHLASGLDARAGMTRGEPCFAPVMRDLRHLDGYQEAEVIAARMSAAAPAVVTTTDQNGEVATPEIGFPFQVDMEPGQYLHLGLNQKLEAAPANHPNSQFPEFSKQILRGVAAGLGCSYAAIANDLSEANYSSMKVGRQDERDGWEADQNYLITHFCQRVFDAWLESAMLVGAVAVPGYDLARANRIEWHGRRWASPDPLKDIQADVLAVALGVRSRQQIVEADGADFDETLEALAYEQAAAQSAGVSINPTTHAQANEPTSPAASGDGGSSSATGASGGRDAGTRVALLRSAG